MDNPFVPSAGAQPPELAGREEIISAAKVAIARIKRGRAARSRLLLGLRGVGKTVLLNRIAEMAEELGCRSIVLEAPEQRRLAELLVPPLRRTLFTFSRMQHARDLSKRGLGILRSFARTFKIKVGDVEFTVEPVQGAADSGDLEADLPEVLLAVAAAAKAAGSAVALLIDEVQYLSQPDLAALIVSLHQLAQKNLPFLFFGAGLPQLAALAGEARSYAERLFEYVDVGPLTNGAARDAIATPIRRQKVDITAEAVDHIVRQSQGYPYFLQEWGHHTWNAADASPIDADDARKASGLALRALDSGFFRVRLDRLTPREKEYVRAMAELGPGPHRSGEVADRLGMDVTAAGPLRNGLIRKGMIFSPQHGDTAFTVPMFEAFLKRSMPRWRKTKPDRPKPKRKPNRRDRGR